MWTILDGIASRMIHEADDRYIAEGFHLVSGHARGADQMAERWSREFFPLEEIERWVADWSQGKRAGIVRNVAMVDSLPDECVAFIMPCDKPNCPRPQPHGSHGAVHCADYAASRGIPTSRFYGGGFQ
jgi:hypothetical protein